MDLLAPLLFGIGLLWLVGRNTPWSARLVTIAVTLAIILAIILIERSGLWPESLRRV